MVAKKKAVKKKAKPRAPRAPSAASRATALAVAALKRAQTRSVMEDVKSRYAARYGRAPTEAMARSIMAAIAAGIPIDATFRDPDPLVVAPPTQTQVPLVALNSGPMGQAGMPRVVPAALVPQVGPAQGQAPFDRAAAANRRLAVLLRQLNPPAVAPALAPLVGDVSGPITGALRGNIVRESAGISRRKAPSAALVSEQSDAIRGRPRAALQGEQSDAMRGRPRAALEGEQSEAIRGRPRAALEGEQSEAIRGRPATQPPVLIQDPVSADTGYSTARLQQRDRDLTVLRESRDEAVRAMQEQAQANVTPGRRTEEENLMRMLSRLQIAPDLGPLTVEQLDSTQAWKTGPLGDTPVIPQAPPGMQVKMRMARTGPRPVIRDGVVQFEAIPPLPPVLLPSAPPVDERAAFLARAAANAANLQAARDRQTAEAAAAYQQQMAAMNPRAVQPAEVVVPAEAVLPEEVGALDIAGDGSKVQSISFPIDQWSSASALRWLRAHGFVPQKKGEAKANYLRYRIRAPRFSRYITRTVHSKGRMIHLIIGA